VVRVPLGPTEGGPKDYFALVDAWVGGLVQGYRSRQGGDY
jgi:hypothetical protein